MTEQERTDLEQRVANALDVPEPSPLFWEHFPGRVRAAIAAAPPSPAVVWWRRRAFVMTCALALAGGLSSWAVWQATRDGGAGVEPTTIVEAPVGDQPIVSLDEAGDDTGWEVVSSVAASAGIETLREAGFGVSPGGADAAIEGLSEAERATLVALLQEEMDVDEGGL